jgi:hypothetical protein
MAPATAGSCLFAGAVTVLAFVSSPGMTKRDGKNRDAS